MKPHRVCRVVVGMPPPASDTVGGCPCGSVICRTSRQGLDSLNMSDVVKLLSYFSYTWLSLGAQWQLGALKRIGKALAGNRRACSLSHCV